MNDYLSLICTNNSFLFVYCLRKLDACSSSCEHSSYFTTIIIIVAITKKKQKNTQVNEWFFCTCCNLVLKRDHVMQSTCWPSSPVFNKAIVTFLGVSWKSLQGFITLELRCHKDQSLSTFFASLAIRSFTVYQPRSQYWTLKVCSAMSYLENLSTIYQIISKQWRYE